MLAMKTVQLRLQVAARQLYNLNSWQGLAGAVEAVSGRSSNLV